MPFLGFCFNTYGPFQGQNELFLAEYVTLIIGKNNSGKSSAIDILCRMFDSDQGRTYASMPETMDLHYALDEETIKAVFPENRSGGGIPGESQYEFGKQFIGKRFVARFMFPTTLVAPTSNYNDQSVYDKRYENYWQMLAQELVRSFDNYKDRVAIRRLTAERDILPEEASANLELTSRGEGASNLVQKYINESVRDESIIEEKLLASLNEIMVPDAEFQSIRVQTVKQGGVDRWEIFLQEKGKQRFPLSATGSGLKTVILVLLNLLVLDSDGSKERIFCFEELENNLHPSLQRRLFDYLYSYARANAVKIVLTSHSQVAINTFFGLPDALIYHAQKNQDGTNRLIRIASSDEGREVLLDLGVKASDLFQTNGIIWVEGPSDRVYIKAWLETLYGDEFVEGMHYQFLYYGGKILSHYTAEETVDKINVMFTNLNSAIIMDSDKNSSQVNIRATKQRVRKEFNSRGLFYWITSGREIENYVSLECLQRAFGKKAPSRQIDAFESFPDYISKTYKGFTSKKVDFAKEVTEHISADDLNVLDLRRKIEDLRNTILKWNS